MLRLFCLITAICLTLPNLAAAAGRFALIIGNDTYAYVPTLEKARNDARAMADTLAELDFTVTRVLDADRREMNRSIATFTGRLQPGDTALVFFAGHGVEIDGENYLLPIDIEAPDTASEDFIKFESIGLSDVLERVQRTGARTTLMFIDACRDNPFAQTGGRSIGGTRGLARVTAPEGTFVVFSAGAQQQALDRLSSPDDNPNSVFTRVLLPKLKQPELELRQLISDVRLEVRDLALQQNHQQFPAYYDELLGQFFFASDASETSAQVTSDASNATETTTVGQSDPTPNDTLKADFDLARSINSVVAFEAFLEKHGGTSDLLVSIITRELEQLRNDEAPTPLANREEPAQPVREEASNKEIIRLSQQRLNALGCAAGGADGIIGPRTRRAFQDFLDQSDPSIGTASLGSQAALDELNVARGTVCKPRAVVASESAPARSSNAPASSAPTLSGTWSFTSQCPLFISSVGTTTYRSQGGNSYAVSTQDNLGNTARGTARNNGNGSLQIRLVWQNGTSDNYTAFLSADQRTISGKNTFGCSFIANKR